jgi:hypothetical protein
MTITIESIAKHTFVPMLRTLAELLDKGAAHAAEAGADLATLLGARLAPDMYPLTKQVELACFNARDAIAHLAGGVPPAVEDNDGESLAELKARIARTIDAIEAVPADAFAGADAREIEHALVRDLVLRMNGLDYLLGWGVPHFYFHVVTAYDILRSQGVGIGKIDYMRRVGRAIGPRAR